MAAGLTDNALGGIRLHTAQYRSALDWDMRALIPGYVVGLLVAGYLGRCVFWASRSRAWALLGIATALLAGVCNLAQDVLLLSALSDGLLKGALLDWAEALSFVKFVALLVAGAAAAVAIMVTIGRLAMSNHVRKRWKEALGESSEEALGEIGSRVRVIPRPDIEHPASKGGAGSSLSQPKQDWWRDVSTGLRAVGAGFRLARWPTRRRCWHLRVGWRHSFSISRPWRAVCPAREECAGQGELPGVGFRGRLHGRRPPVGHDYGEGRSPGWRGTPPPQWPRRRTPLFLARRRKTTSAGIAAPCRQPGPVAGRAGCPAPRRPQFSGHHRPDHHDAGAGHRRVLPLRADHRGREPVPAQVRRYRPEHAGACFSGHSDGRLVRDRRPGRPDAACLPYATARVRAGPVGAAGRPQRHIPQAYPWIFKSRLKSSCVSP